MKKLIVLLTIIILCVSMISAEKATNPFKFSLSNRLKARVEDEWKIGVTQDDKTAIANSPQTDGKGKYVNLEELIEISAKTTIAEIYTLSFKFADQLRLPDPNGDGASGSLDQNVFTVTWGNQITPIKDYLNIDINIGWSVIWDNSVGDNTTGTATAMSGQFDAHGQGDRGYLAKIFQYQNKENFVNLQLPMSIGLSGKIKQAGFAWSVSQGAKLLFNTEYWKDNDPTGAAHEDEPYRDQDAVGAITPLDGAAEGIEDGSWIAPMLNYTDGGFGGLFEGVTWTTNLKLSLEILHWFAPENITLTFIYSHKLQICAPYSYYYEIDKEFQNDIKFGMELGLAGPKVYAGIRARLYDFWNTSAPLNGHMGSIWNYSNATYAEADGVEYLPVKNGDESDSENFTLIFDHPPHENPALRIGPEISFSYKKDWFEIGTYWFGYARDLRRWDPAGKNGNVYWRNDFEVYAKFSL